MKERNNQLMKKLDRYIGCPLLYFLGAVRHKALRQEIGEKPRILLLKTAAMGDTILMDAIIREIKAWRPQSKITFVCSGSNLGMVKALEHIDSIINFDMKKPLSSLKAVRSSGNYDLVLDFAPWARINGLITWAAQARYKVGFKRKHMHRHYIYDCTAEHMDTVHELENYRNILRAAQIPVQGFTPCFQIGENKRYIAGDYAIFHLYPAGSSVQLRQWDNKKWLALGKQIFENYGFKICLSGGKEDAGDAEVLVRQMKESGIEAISIAGKYNLKEMEAVLAQAELLVSVNTGIMHMGAAVGVPLVALHGATSVIRWGPLSANTRNVWAHESCQPCISLGFESKCKNPVCMQHISVGMVMNNVQDLIGISKEQNER